MTITREEFLSFSSSQVAEIVRKAGEKVCVFPVNGTRRWFALEYGEKMEQFSDPVAAYLDIAGREHIRLYKLLFEHGIQTLLTPVFGSELLTRGEHYTRRIGADGLARLATHPDFLAFYKQYNVRVRFYGDYKRHLANTEFDYLIDMFNGVTIQTRHHESFRLFYGVFANDATESVADIGARHFQKTGKVPTRHEVLEMYYGEYVPPASFFIGFDKFSVFDYPLLGLGEEDLYFTAAPSLYLDERQLREILYDHLFSRRIQEPDYTEMSENDWVQMRKYYTENRGVTLGVGEVKGGLWYPILPKPQMEK